MKRMLMLAFLLLLGIPTFAQGLYWQSKTEGTVGERVTDTYVVPQKMKVVTPGSPTMILRLDREVLWQVNDAEKTYSEVTFEQLEKMMQKVGSKMDQAMAKMQEEMKDMPAEQRKMIEQMMGKQMGAGTADVAPEVRSTGEKKTISGFACTEYVVRHGEELMVSVWTTRSVKGFDAMKEDWKKFAARMAAMTPRFGKAMSEAYSKIEGFPIRTEMGHGIITTVTKVEQKATPAAEFEIPKGYKQVRGEFEEAMEKMEEEE